MTLIFPFLILSIISYFLSIYYKVSIFKSFLLTSILISLFLIFFGKIGLLSYTIIGLNFITIILSIFLLVKKKYNEEFILKIIYLLIIYLLLIWICNDLYFHKFDEFSEYGITSRLIFSENNVPSNIEYLIKGSSVKINFVSYFHYFFLKNTTLVFKEEIVYLAQSFFIIIVLNVILDFIKVSFLKKILITIIFYFIILSLGPGLDRIYMDSIIGLFITLIFLFFFKNEKSKIEYTILFIIVFTFPMIKANGIIIFLGILPILIFSKIFSKDKSIISSEYKSMIIIVLAFLCNFIFTKFYISKLTILNSNKFEHLNIYKIDKSSSFDISNLFLPSYKLKKNLDFTKIIKAQYDLTISNGIYHSKTFLVLNKIINQLNLNFKLIEIPLNLFFWFLIIFLISFFISKKDKHYRFITGISYLVFIIFYYFFLIYWGIINNLVNDDYSIEISWQRHLGSLILGFILFALSKFFNFYKNFLTIFFIFIISINITMPNSLRIFFPSNVIASDYWDAKSKKRSKVKKLSLKISQEINDYSTLMIVMNFTKDPYFQQIIKYELIKIDTQPFAAYNILKNVTNKRFNSNNNKLYFLIEDFYFNEFKKNFEDLLKQYNHGYEFKVIKNLDNFYLCNFYFKPLLN